MSDHEKLDESEESPACPICKRQATSEQTCIHVVISADDSDLLESVFEFAGAMSLLDEWQHLKKGDVSYIVVAETLVAPCPSTAKVCSQTWDGGYPGLNGVWTNVWSDDPGKLAYQIRERIDQDLQQRKKPKAKRQKADKEFAAKATIAAETLHSRLAADGGGVISLAAANEGSSKERRPLEPRKLPTQPPTKAELEARKELFWLADTALTISNDRHPLCVKALETLALFSEGSKGYNDLEDERKGLAGRAAGAGMVGLVHKRANAASTLAVFHACNPWIEPAIEITHSFFERTVEFKRASLVEKGNFTNAEIGDLDSSVQKTFFTGLNGEYLGRVGQIWNDSRGSITILSAWNPDYQQINSEINKLQNTKLESVLRDSDHSFQPLVAWWPTGEGFEEAFVIADLDLSRSSELAKQFQQAAFFFANRGEPVAVVRV